MSYVDSPFNNPRILSICTGMRGIERGLERALGPVDVVAYVEREAFIIENLIIQMECGLLDSAPVWSDLRTFNGNPFRGRIHGVVGGYPCQGESVAGNMLGTKDPRFLWWDIERIIKAVDPVWCFFENVRNHINQSFPLVLASLRAMGYRVESGIFSANEVGAPHQRERLFILATKLGNTKYDGSHGQPKQGSPRTPGNRPKKGKNQTEQPERADRFRNDSGLQKCKLANPYSNRYGVYPRRNETQSRTLKETPWYQNRERVWGESRNQGSELADSNESRLWREHKQGVQSEAQRSIKKLANACSFRGTTRFSRSLERKKRYTGITVNSSNQSQWPAGPGPEQYEWEAPRAVESGMGCTVNGYNFREDLLRMYGNGVVEQQAEKAIRILLEKHGIKL